MAVDLNEVARKLQQQKGLGVNQNGVLTPTNPENDGTKARSTGSTTLEPKRFFFQD
jgi:hypothetical protein